MEKSLTIKSITEPYSMTMISNGLLLGTISGIGQGTLFYILTLLFGGFNISIIYG
jgi:hypothetical protein